MARNIARHEPAGTASSNSSIGSSDERLMPGKSWWGLAAVFTCFLTLYFLVHTTESGDTLRYAGDVVHYAKGEKVPLWEFGHLLWRPWGLVGYRLTGSWIEHVFGDSDTQAVARFFIATNFVCCLVLLGLFWDLLRRRVPPSIATLTVVAFCGANSFLDYVAVGSAYLPALCFECLALWLMAKSSRRGQIIWAALAGASFAMAVLLWFPYIFAGLGLLCIPIFWPEGSGRKLPVRQMGVFLAGAGLVYCAVLGAGAAQDGIRSGVQFKQWIVDSDSGWSQHLNLVRAATGVPRSLYELASDTILLKRWFFHDPYNPVQLGQLAGALLLKLALFYTGLAALLWILMRERSAWRALLVLLAAGLPLLFFAIVVFEPGSTSRYLPLLPFLYIAAAVALATGKRQRWAYGGLIVLLVSAFVLNVATLTRGTSQRAAAVYRERDLLDRTIQGHALVFIPTLHDAFYEVPLTRPIDHGLASGKYLTVDIVEPASLRLLHWRAEFASRVLEAWKRGDEVWVSQRVYAQQPAGDGPWVEGDDARIHWAELPPFFAQFATDKTIPAEGGEGFRRLADTAANREILSGLVAKDSKFRLR